MIYKKQKKNKNPEKRVCTKVPAEKSIDFRPEEANTREEYGHWEGDLVVGKRERGINANGSFSRRRNGDGRYDQRKFI